VIYFNNVSKVYNEDSTALDNVNLTVTTGEFVSIIGHSGAGKTTLIKMILADEVPTSGTVFFESTNVSRLKNRDLTKLRRRIGVVFQDFKLLSNKTAYENIAFAMEAVGKTNEEIESDVPHVLELVDLSKKMHNFPNQMSGGEQQRLAIARAIINQPELIIADEPTGNLDSKTGEMVMATFERLNKENGKTIVLITHEPDIAMHADRIIVIKDGLIIEDKINTNKIKAK